MANELRKQQVRTKIRKNLRLDVRTATLGDINGVVHEPGRPGWVRIRYSASANNTGNLSWPTVVRFDRNFDDSPGKGVIIGYDEEGELAVLKLSARAAEIAGDSPLGNASNNNTVNGVVDMNNVPILRSQPFGTGAPLYVSVLPFIYVRGRTYHHFGGVIDGVDLSGSIPATPNQHLIAGLFLKTDDTVETILSTAKDVADIIDDDDFQEIVTASTLNSIPIVAYRLYYGQTEITDTDKRLDMRQWINVPTFGSTTPFSITNGTLDHGYDADVTSTAELADALYTLITELKAAAVLPS